MVSWSPKVCEKAIWVLFLVVLGEHFTFVSRPSCLGCASFVRLEASGFTTSFGLFQAASEPTGAGWFGDSFSLWGVPWYLRSRIEITLRIITLCHSNMNPVNRTTVHTGPLFRFHVCLAECNPTRWYGTKPTADPKSPAKVCR